MNHDPINRDIRQNELLVSLFLLVILVFIFFNPALFRGASVYDVDLRLVQTPIKWFLFKAKGNVLFPLWTENIGCGYPIHAYGEGGLLYPFNWLVYPFLMIPIAHDVTLMMHLLIAGAGMLFLGRNYHGSFMGSLVSAVVYMFSGWMCIHFGHLNSIQVCAWIPWAFLALDMNKQSLRPISAMWLGICIALMFLAGRPQIAFYAWVALAIHTMLRSVGRSCSIRFFVVFGCGTFLGLMLAAPQIFPTLEFVNVSKRSSGIPYDAQLLGTVSWDQFLWIVAPLWEKENTIAVSSESIGYIGMVSGFLLLVSLKQVRDRFYYSWWIVIGFSLLLTTGEKFPLNAWIYQMPGFAYFRCPARWLSICSFAVSILVGYGTESLLQKVNNNLCRNILGVILVTVVFCDLYYFVHPVVSFLDRKAQEAEPQAVPVLLGGGRYISLNTIPIFILELERDKIPHKRYAEYFSARETLNDNLGMRYGLRSVGFYVGLYPRWMGQGLSKLTQESLSSMNCEFLISPQPILGSRLREIWKNQFFHIYRNEAVKPRARLVASLKPNGDQSFISNGDIRGSTLIFKDKSQGRLAIEVNAQKDGFLLLADTFYPGWRANINGKETRILRTNGWMRAVPIPAGRSKVLFLYQPFSFQLGLGVTLMGILIVLLIVLKYSCDKRNHLFR